MKRVVARDGDQRPEKRDLEGSLSLAAREGTGRDGQAKGSYQTRNLLVP